MYGVPSKRLDLAEVRDRVCEERLRHFAVDKNVPYGPDGKLTMVAVEASRGKVYIAGGASQTLVAVPEEAVDTAQVMLDALHNREATSHVMKHDRAVHGPSCDQVVHILAVAPGDICRRIIVTVELAKPQAPLRIADVYKSIDCASGEGVATALKADTGNSVRELDGCCMVLIKVKWVVSDVEGAFATRIFKVHAVFQGQSEFSLTLVHLS